MSLEEGEESHGAKHLRKGQGSKMLNVGAPGDSLRMIPLLDAMVDVVLVYGFDETCSKELVITDDEEDLDRSMDALNSQYALKLHFLQIITPGQIYPQRSMSMMREGGEVSPCRSRRGTEPEEDGVSATFPLPPKRDKEKFNVEDFGLSWDNIETMHFFIFQDGKNSSVASPAFLTPPIHLTCASPSPPVLSEGPRIYTNVEELPPSIIPLLFTNLVGERSFRSVLRFTRPFFITRHSGSRYFSLLPWSPETTLPQGCRYRLVYLPMCLVLVSKRPCFQFMKDVLSGFHSYFVEEGDDRDFWDLLKDFTERIFLIPCPPPGSLSVKFQLPGLQSSLVVQPPRGRVWAAGTSSSSTCHTLQCPEQYLDIRLTYPFMCLSEQNILQVISAMLTEQTIIFVSSLYPMLTYVIQSFLAYVSPFVWRHSIIPTLPYPLLEVLDAPVATIIGIHSSFTSEPEFHRIENSVVVDLDNDTVRVILQNNSLPALPKSAVEIFLKSYAILKKQYYEVHTMQKLSSVSSSRKQLDREEFDRFMDGAIAKIFLELMVRLYSKVIKQLLQSRMKYEETVRAMEPEEQAFYRQTEATDMFSVFYQNQKQGAQVDEFNLLGIRLEREERRQQGQELEESLIPAGTKPPSAVSLSNSMSLFTFSRKYCRKVQEEEGRSSGISPIAAFGGTAVGGAASTVEVTTMELPALGLEFMGREQFLDEIIVTLDELQRNPAVQAQCVCLRGYYLLCKRNVVQALEDFYDTLQRLEVTLVPEPKNLKVFLNFLSATEKAELQDHSHFKHMLSCKKKTFIRRPGIVDLCKTMPRKPMNHADFLTMVHQNAIATDAESASNLHRVLALDRTTVVAPEVFKTFYEAWKVVLLENVSVEVPNIVLGRAEMRCRIAERILAVTHEVRTNYGSQSTLVLTTYRLLAVAGFDTHVMAEFNTPIRFEFFSYAASIIAAKNPGIRVEHLVKSKLDRKKTQDIFMAFEDHVDRENWYHLLVEMLAGWQLSQRLKDPCVMETAECHVLLQNAVNQSGILDDHNHVQRTKRSKKLLSFQSKDASEISPITVEALQYRINPCLHETEKQTVESLLYIPPSVDEGQGKIWIGLGNGRLKVYDIESKSFESNIKITESKHGRSVRLSCLLLVNQHVWVGSFSKNIHILDVDTVCHVSQLSCLEDAPRGMELSEDRSVVWSLLLNGVLLAWDPVTRKRISKMQVPMSENTQYTTCTCFTIWRDHIWVGTNRGSISVMDSHLGSRIKEIFFPGGSKRQVEIKHLAISSEGEIWCSVYYVPRGVDSNFVAVFNPHTHEKLMMYTKLDNRVSVILPVNNSMWCGTKSGKIYIFHSRTYANGKNMPKVLSAHEDFIRTMTLTDINLVVSGSGSNDGYAAVWKTIELPD